MIFTKRLELEIFIFLLLGMVIGAFFVFHNKQTPVQNFQTLPNLLATPTSTPTPIITFIPTVTTTSQISPDGIKKVIMKTTANQDNTRTYEVATDENGPTIFRKTLTGDDTLSIPYNTWDPQDRYFFLQEHTASGPAVMVFQESGDQFTDGESYLDLTGAFAKLQSGNTFDVATGWGGYGLIVFNTKLSDNSQGPSYWFEVPSQNITQLSTKF